MVLVNMDEARVIVVDVMVVLLVRMIIVDVMVVENLEYQRRGLLKQKLQMKRPLMRSDNVGIIILANQVDVDKVNTDPTNLEGSTKRVRKEVIALLKTLMVNIMDLVSMKYPANLMDSISRIDLISTKDPASI